MDLTEDSAELADWLDLGTPPPTGRTLAHLVPDSYAAIVRVLYPALRVGATLATPDVAWLEMADEVGVRYGPEIRWRDIESRRVDTSGWQEDTPASGQITDRERGLMTRILESFTTTPESCYFALWDGYNPLPEPRAKPTAVTITGRGYLLFEGTIDEFETFAVGDFLRFSFNYAWPRDRAWLVVADIDLRSAFVACPEECATALISSPLEAHQVKRSHPIPPE